MAKQKISLLDTIAAGTASEQGYALIDRNSAELASLVSAGKVEVNPNFSSADGTVAARIAAPVSASEPSVAAPRFVLESGIVPAEPKRGGGKGTKAEIYPFSTMEVGMSFVIAATEKQKNPAKSFATTVSSATRRFATPSATETKKNRKGEDVPVLVPTRKFTIRPVKAGQTYPNGYVETLDGARIFRTA